MTTPKPYRPSNGTEFDCFYSHWCAHCVHDEEYREHETGGCKILAASMANEQPDEWIYENDTPTCTAFRGEPLPEPRCPLTMEMFDNE